MVPCSMLLKYDFEGFFDVTVSKFAICNEIYNSVS